MEVAVVKDAFDCVTKKQKLSSSKAQEVIDKVSHEIEQILAEIQSVDNPISPVDLKYVLADLKCKFDAISPLNQLEGTQKEINLNLRKFPKLLDKIFDPDISKAHKKVDFEFHIVNQIIASHFYRLGLFDLGDCLVNEAGEQMAAASRSQFVELYQIIEAMKVKNIEPALHWVSANRERLEQTGSVMELKLHGLQFADILRRGSHSDALNYAKTYLAPFASNHLKEVQKILVCIMWIGRLERCPHSDLLAPIHWEKLSEELARDFCSLLGQSFQSPLSVAIAAGIEGLPTLLKLANVMAARKQDLQSMEQLPVPVDLGKEFQFHSIFICPVSRDQGGEENPPMLMPCLHVLCKQSIMKLSKGSARTFKCPYCPTEASVARCRQLFL